MTVIGDLLGVRTVEVVTRRGGASSFQDQPRRRFEIMDGDEDDISLNLTPFTGLAFFLLQYTPG